MSEASSASYYLILEHGLVNLGRVKNTYIVKSHFNVEFDDKNLPKNSTYFSNQVNQTRASKMAVFANCGVLAGPKIHHF